MKLKFKRGFSLIEMIVVIGVISIALPALFAIVFTILQQQIRIYRLTEIKRQGDSSLTTIQNTIRSTALGVYTTGTGTDIPACGATEATKTATALYFKKGDGEYFRFYLNTTRLVYNPGTENFITNNNVLVSDYVVSCKQANTFSPAIISISYKVKTNPATALNRTFIYRSKIVLRN